MAQVQTLAHSACRLASGTAIATAGSRNEVSLVHELELLLRTECAVLQIPHIPYQLGKTLRGGKRNPGFADVVHGGIIIEYEPPRSFSGGRRSSAVSHAKHQAQDYALRMTVDEGRPIQQYVLVIWDGAHIAFGSTDGNDHQWGPLAAFDAVQAEHLLRLLVNDGRPLVHPGLLRAMVGPESKVGSSLMSALFQAVLAADVRDLNSVQTKTTLLFREWKLLFGQAIGINTKALGDLLHRQSKSHGQPYNQHVSCYLFALHTVIALAVRLVSALALPSVSQDITDDNVDLKQRMLSLESGQMFASTGVSNMLSGDFFSWPADDPNWPIIQRPLQRLLSSLRNLSFDMTKKRPETVRDLFKGLYEDFVPRELRHALGEVYTPDWMADHALDAIDWQPNDQLLDPTCGTGTFLLQALGRRFEEERKSGRRLKASELLGGLYGIDLNPVAVLATKASIVVELSDRLDGSEEVTLPIFLGDAINTATSEQGNYVHRIQTEKGERLFKLPKGLVESGNLFGFFEKLRPLILSELDEQVVQTQALKVAGSDLGAEEKDAVTYTVSQLIALHKDNWDGIWCPIIADRFAVGSIPRVSHIAGNPPWVKWSHLPPDYAAFIKPLCSNINVFSDARYVGGIESDISTVITFFAINKWLAPRGSLAFYITATVFSNESSQGFRRFENPDGSPMCKIRRVEDFKQIDPFQGVTNHPALLLLLEGSETCYPVTYRVWERISPDCQQLDTNGFLDSAKYTDLQALPVPGTDSGPWLKGTESQLRTWKELFDAKEPSEYKARKGVTTDRNGIYFVKVLKKHRNNNVQIRNDPNLGRISNIPEITSTVESTHIFPLVRGRGVSAFLAEVDPEYRILIPQRGMHGDDQLPSNSPLTYSFLAQFKDALLQRGSYRRYQRGKPFWSTWSTGHYTFSRYKVMWKEMSGNRFCAAYIGPVNDPVLGERIAIPDHKVYMVPVDSVEQAKFLTGILNAPTVAAAISAYASQLSLGTTVIEYLKIPAFDPMDELHQSIVLEAGRLTDERKHDKSRLLSGDSLTTLDDLVLKVIQ